MFGDRGLVDDNWPIIHRSADWLRAEWPMPMFGRINDFKPDAGYCVRYDENNLAVSLREWKITADQALQLPCDGLAGHIYLQLRFNMTTSRQYDVYGAPCKYRRARVTTTYSYNDPENNLTGVQYSAHAGVTQAGPISLTYDGFGRLATADNGVTNNQYAYDDDDSPTSVQTGFYSGGSIAFSKTISYTYNPDGSKASTVTPSGTFSYTYDPAGRATTITNPFGETTSWGYLNNGWVSGQQLSNGAATYYNYDPRGELTQLLNQSSALATLSNFSGMTYDDDGNRTYLAASVPPEAAYGGTTTYSYDARNELSNETSTKTGGYNNSFAYDAAENPTTVRSVLLG